MVGFAPFAGHHIRPDFVRRVPAPAFDSMNSEQRTEYLETHPESYALVTRSPGDGGPEDDATVQRLIELGGKSFDRILALNAFHGLEAGRPAMFLYRLATESRQQVGVVGLVDTADYLSGRVKRHEQVSAERAVHLSAHFETLGVQSSPIALGYRADPAVRAILDDVLARIEPSLSFTSGDGLEQTVWVVDEPEVTDALTKAFETHDLYIMDGHHRAAAAGLLYERVGSPRGDKMLGLLFSDDRVNIEPFHRRVVIPDNRDLSACTTALVEALDLRPDDSGEHSRPEMDGGIGVYLDGRWWSGTLPTPVSNSPLDEIDPVRLQREVLGPILGVEPETATGQISYFLDDVDRQELASRLTDREVLFVLSPVTPAEVFAVADAGLDMPPKSTYVTPKPRSGVFLRRF